MHTLFFISFFLDICLRATCDSLPIYQHQPYVSKTQGARFNNADSDPSSSSEYVITQSNGFLAKYSYLEAVGEDDSPGTNSTGTLILATKTSQPSSLSEYRFPTNSLHSPFNHGGSEMVGFFLLQL
jgi:hypothetical protein